MRPGQGCQYTPQHGLTLGWWVVGWLSASITVAGSAPRDHRDSGGQFRVRGELDGPGFIFVFRTEQAV